MSSNTEMEKQTFKAVRQAIKDAIAVGDLCIVDLETPRIMDDFIKRQTRNALDDIHVRQSEDAELGSTSVERKDEDDDEDEEPKGAMFVEGLSVYAYDDCIIAEMEDMLQERQNSESGSAKQRSPKEAEKASPIGSNEYQEHKNKRILELLQQNESTVGPTTNLSHSSETRNSDDNDDASDAASNDFGDLPSAEDDTADLPNMLGPDEHFSRNNPRPLYVRFASGPNGQSTKSRYPHEVVWSDADSIHKLNHWRRQKERQANKKWGDGLLRRHAVIEYAAEHTQWLADQLKGDKGAMSHSMVKSHLVPRFQARYPNPQRLAGSPCTHINRNATIRKGRGLDLLVNKSHATATADGAGKA